MRLTSVTSKSRCKRVATTTTQIHNHLPTEQIEVFARGFLHQKDSATVRRLPVEHEWIYRLAIYQSNIRQTMESLEFPNPIEYSSIRRRIDICGADNIHEGSIAVAKKRDNPPTTERDRDIEFVAQLPEMFPPTVRGQVAKAIIIFQKYVCAKTNFHLENLK
jgi:hypothetical protein